MVADVTFDTGAGTATYRVQFHDEWPNLGCGWRTVQVKVGRKWVHMRSPRRKIRKRITPQLWETISSNARPVA